MSQAMPHSRTAFIGLGAMGHPMAGHLAKAGHRVTVFNRTGARAEAWCGEYGGHTAETPAAADRKSTRLNSSHQPNSDAVFCLKKTTPHPHPPD